METSGLALVGPFLVCYTAHRQAYIYVYQALAKKKFLEKYVYQVN